MNEVMQIDKLLPVGSMGRKSGGWWGMITLIATEASLFGYLLFSYFYLASQTEQHWPPEGLPNLLVPGLNTLILLTSSAFVWGCELGLERKKAGWGLTSLLIAIVLGGCFVLIQLNEWGKKPYDMTSNLYGSMYFTITGFHMVHVVIGLIMLITLFLWIALGYFDNRRYVAVTIGGMYWHFVDVVWLFVFATLYLTPFM